MAACPFRDLPPELVCNIFMDLGRISDVVHLAGASSSFNAVWKNHARSVCSAVMPRSIPCFQDAVAMFTIQDGRSKTRSREIFDETTSEAAILVAQRLCVDASTVARACGVFEADTHPRLPRMYATVGPGMALPADGQCRTIAVSAIACYTQW